MNRKLAKAREQKTTLLRHSQSILDAANAQNRDMTDSEQAALDADKIGLESVAATIAEEEAREEYRRTGMPVRETGFETNAPGQLDGMGGATERLGKVSRFGKIGAKYRDLFGCNLSNDGWSSSQEFFGQIHSGMAHPRLANIAGGTGSAGGWLVPTEYAAEMLDAAMESSIVMPRARIYPMTSETKKIAGFDSSTNTSSTLYGGLEAQWIGEGSTGSLTNPTVRKIELKAKKLALFTATSNEVAEDGLGLDGQLDEALRQGNNWFLDYAFLRGTGVGQPLGVLNDPALISVTIETAQDADSLVYENLCNMLGRLHPGCFNNAVWVCNPSCIPQLLQLSQPIGTGGVQVPILKEAGGGWQIFTRPLLMSEKLPPIGDEGDIILADFSQYAIGLRKDVTIEKSGHIYFMNDETAWRAITRVDGQGRWNQAFTPANGSTQSWCVAVAERA